MRWRILIAVVGFVLAGWANAHAEGRAFVPAAGHTMVVIGSNQADIEGYLKEVGGIPAGFMVYTSVQEADGLSDPAPDRGAGVQFAQPLIHRYPDTVIQLGLYMVGALDGIVAGQYDDRLDTIIEWVASARRPVYLRIGYEFDLEANQYDPALYRQAFRYIVDRFRASGVDNAAFVWHSYGRVRPGRPVTEWYPGDDYVDWFGLSFFDAFNKSDAARFARLAGQHGKPLMIAEATPYRVGVLEGERSWTRWFARLFDFIEAWDVHMVCYINSDWEAQPMFRGQGWGDARLDRHRDVKRKWIAKISEPRYLMSSPGLWSELSFGK